MQIVHSQQNEDSCACRFFVYTWDVYPESVNKEVQEAFEAFFRRVPPMSYCEANYEGEWELYQTTYDVAKRILCKAVRKFNKSNPHFRLRQSRNGGLYIRETKES